MDNDDLRKKEDQEFGGIRIKKLDIEISEDDFGIERTSLDLDGCVVKAAY